MLGFIMMNGIVRNPRFGFFRMVEAVFDTKYIGEGDLFLTHDVVVQFPAVGGKKPVYNFKAGVFGLLAGAQPVD